MRGVSGGERKRVCIGNEIMTNPSLLFLDEPTSSLDSTTALKIVQMLQSIAKVRDSSKSCFDHNQVLTCWHAGWENYSNNNPPTVKQALSQIRQAGCTQQRKLALLWESIRSNVLLLFHRLFSSTLHEPSRVLAGLGKWKHERYLHTLSS